MPSCKKICLNIVKLPTAETVELLIIGALVRDLLYSRSQSFADLTTGKKPKKKAKAKIPKKKEPKEVVPNFKDLPPLELDEEACVFSKKDVQSLGGLVAPAFKEDELESPTNASQES